MKPLQQVVTIKRAENQPESMELVAQALLDIADGVKTLRNRAKDNLLVLLLHDMTGVNKRDIKLILDAAPEIAGKYLKNGGR